jgi:hypothetical protein
MKVLNGGAWTTSRQMMLEVAKCSRAVLKVAAGDHRS